MTSTPSRRRFLAAGAASVVASNFAAAVSPQPRKVRIGQVGTKHSHAEGKLKTILKYPELFEFVGIVEPDEARRAAWSGREPYRGLKWMSEAELLESPGLQAVAVETEVEELVPTALRCIKAGLHLHLDKPAGESLAACRELHAEAGRRGLTIQMGYMLRYNPAFEFLFGILRDGWLGEITEVSGMMGKMMNDAGRRDLARFEGGGMFELACHLVDALVTVLGKPAKVTSVTHRTRPGKDAFADNQLAIFDYPKAIATIRCNHIDPLGFPRRQFTVTGTAGTCEIRPLEPPQVRLGLDRPRGDFKKGFQDVELPKAAGRYDGEFLDLARVIRGEKKLGGEAAHDLAVHEAVLRASGMMVGE